MNLQNKQQLAEQAFKIYQDGDNIYTITRRIRWLLMDKNIFFNTENQVSILSNSKTKNAFDRFLDALDAEEIKNAQQMRFILEEHCNFLTAKWVIP